jgi:hypothetical protein
MLFHVYIYFVFLSYSLIDTDITNKQYSNTHIILT